MILIFDPSGSLKLCFLKQGKNVFYGNFQFCIFAQTQTKKYFEQRYTTRVRCARAEWRESGQIPWENFSENLLLKFFYKIINIHTPLEFFISNAQKARVNLYLKIV